MTRLVVSTDELRGVMLGAVARVGQDLFGVGAEAAGVDALETVVALGFLCGAQAVRVNELLAELEGQIGAAELVVGEVQGVLTAYIVGTTLIEELIGFIGMPPTVMPLQPNSEVVQSIHHSFSASGGEGIVGGGSGSISIERLADGQYEVVLKLQGDLGAGGNLGVADGEVGGFGSETLTWFVSGPRQAAELQQALEKTIALGSLGGGLAVLSALQFTHPFSTTVSAGAQGQASASDGSDGAEANASVGGFITSTRSGELDVGTSFSLDVSAHSGVQGLGIAGDAAGSLQGEVTLDPRTGGVRNLDLSGTVTVSGSADVFGQSLAPASGKEIEVRFNADIDVSKLSPALQSELADFASGKDRDVAKVVEDLAAHGITVNCYVYEGTGRSYDIDAGMASASYSSDNLELIHTFSAQI